MAAQQARAQAPQGLLPAYGTDVRVGDLRQQFQRTFDTSPKTPSERIFTFTPAIDISETYDSAVRLRGGFGKDYITRITPVLAGSIEASRLNGTFNYSPQVSFYALHGNQNGVAQNLNTALTATLVEDLLFAELRGFAITQPALGGFNTAGSGGKSDDVQSTSFTAATYLQKRFGETATVMAGYSATRSTMTSLAPKGTAPTQAGLNSNFTSMTENASISSGPEFGRINAALSAVATQYEGASFYNGAHNETITASTAYAYTRMITVTGSVGHENIVYGPGGPKAINGITWSGGFKLTPNADSTINVSYGRQQGGNSFSFDGTYAPTPRIRLLGRYSQGIGTGLQNLQNALAGAAAGPGGIAVDRNSGAPLQLGSLLGQQAGVYRTTIGSLTGILQLDRDTFTVSLESNDRQLLSGSTTGGGIGSNSGITATTAWQHQWSEPMSTNFSLQYGTRTVPGALGGTNQTEAANLSVNYMLSETLSTNGLISHTQTKGRTFGVAPTRDMAVIGLHKAF